MYTVSTVSAPSLYKVAVVGTGHRPHVLYLYSIARLRAKVRRTAPNSQRGLTAAYSAGSVEGPGMCLQGKGEWRGYGYTGGRARGGMTWLEGQHSSHSPDMDCS